MQVSLLGEIILRPYFFLALLVLLLRLVTALPLERAGYMDASYTQHVGANLARGRGFTQDIVWNYLEEQKTIPQPSNLYWLPLPSLLSGMAMAVFGISYRAAQLPFILLSLVPPLFAFYLARRLYARDDYAWMAGLLTAFSGFYTVYWISPDNFTPFAVTTDFALLCLAFGVLKKQTRFFLAAGIFAGLAQLSRADAALLLIAALCLLLWHRRVMGGNFSILALLAMGGGLALIFAPWLVRNYLAIGTPFAPGNARTLWLSSYDEFFSFDVARLTMQRYLDWGIANIAISKFNALWFIVLVLMFGVWQIFLAPFAVVGFWRERARVELQVAVIYLVLLVLAMAFVFTFPATHGSMLHSAAALVAYGAVMVPPGLDVAVAWLGKRRKSWNVAQAQKFFRWGAVGLAIFFSMYLYAQGVWLPPGQGATAPLWNERDIEFAAIDTELSARSVPAESPIITVDPPSFVNSTGRRSIYMPTESVDAIFDAARQFGADYLVLQYDRPATLGDLYDGQQKVNGLSKIATVQDGLGRPVTLFEITR